MVIMAIEYRDYKDAFYGVYVFSQMLHTEYRVLNLYRTIKVYQCLLHLLTVTSFAETTH